jgi:integrase
VEKRKEVVSVAIYQRGNQWWIEFSYKGKRYREAIGPDEDLARDVLAQRRVEIRENRFFPDKVKEPDPVRFHDFAKQYLEWAKANKKPLSYRNLLSLMRQVNREFEQKTIQEITTWQIEKYKAKRKEEAKKPRKKIGEVKNVIPVRQAKVIKPATVNRELALLKHMFTKAIEWGKLKENPAKKVKLLKGEVRRVRYLMPGEVQILLSNCADHLRPIVTVALNTGMRKGELLALMWNQVNFEQGIITLIETKNNERRDIPMNETVKATLKEIEPKGDHVFYDGDGKTFRNVRRSFDTAIRKSKIEDFRFHDLRHTFASNLVMEGVDIMTVKELMGHKDLTMTLRYSHLAPNHKTKAVNILDQAWSQFTPQSEKEKKVQSIRR